MVAGYANAAGVTWLDDAAEDADTVVCIASAGKWIVAACVAVLVRQGDLDPSLPVRTLLPELPDWAAPIRLHHLIHHTSGLPDRAVMDRGFAGEVSEWTNETVLGLLSTMPEPQAEPGTEFSYCTTGYVCLTELVERAGGRPIAEVAQQHLFTPLGMASTQFWKGPGLHPPTVTAHPPWHPGVPAPQTGDGVWSTARDMLRWAEAMQTGALGPRLTATLRQPGKLRDNTMIPYAWGASILPGGETPAYAHPGSWPGCQTYVITAPATGTAAVVIAYTDDSQKAETLGRKLAGVDQDPGSDPSPGRSS
ncbi:lipoprotein [Paractinoplanes rishiriensis]|uniref:Lipoprotein n=1 Tax=Paractinoplanes rishiriensis TaxID=1050105 RepID=A0A919KDA5_9ACTN|nr:lipoprotein [Actinoplanes rishiriensis]